MNDEFNKIAKFMCPKDKKIDLTWEEGKKILKECTSRVGCVIGRPYIVEILYNGDWWKLARTDLIDDVCTYCSYPEPYGVNIALSSDYRYGIRFHENNVFAIIDSLTDG